MSQDKKYLPLTGDGDKPRYPKAYIPKHDIDFVDNHGQPVKSNITHIDFKNRSKKSK